MKLSMFHGYLLTDEDSRCRPRMPVVLVHPAGMLMNPDDPPWEDRMLKYGATMYDILMLWAGRKKRPKRELEMLDMYLRTFGMNQVESKYFVFRLSIPIPVDEHISALAKYLKVKKGDLGIFCMLEGIRVLETYIETVPKITNPNRKAPDNLNAKCLNPVGDMIKDGLKKKKV